jgi:hypothetical protein
MGSGVTVLLPVSSPPELPTSQTTDEAFPKELMNMNSLNFGMFLSGFLGAGIEFLEIVAIAYALAGSGYAREAFWGTAVGFGIIPIAA